jgi:hypothetical protein
MPLSLRNNQGTARFNEQSVDKQCQKKMKEVRLWSTYVSYVEDNGETRTHCTRGSESDHVIEIDANVSNAPNLK